MGTGAINAFGFIIGTLFGTYAMLLALRFIMQVLRANYYNPLSQFVVKITDPVLVPLRRFIPSIKSYDTSSFLMAYVVLLLKLLAFKFLHLGNVQSAGYFLPAAAFITPSLLYLAFIDLVNLFFNIFIYAAIAQALLSWFPNPATDSIRTLLSGITSPVLYPIQKRIPPIGGLDLSVFIAIIFMVFLQKLIVGTLMTPFLM